MRKLILIIIYLLPCLPSPQESQKRIIHSIERNGWVEPAFSYVGSKVTGAASLKFEGIDVDFRTHVLSEEQITYVERCKPELDETPPIERKAYGVKEFFTYEVNGRVFAYRVKLRIVSVEDGEIIKRTGAASVVLYVDEDGDGTFEARCGVVMENLPAWVRFWSVPK